MKQLLMLFQLLLFGACPFAIESNPLEPSGFNTPLTFTVLLPPHRWLLALSRLWAAYRAVPPEWWLRLTVISFTVSHYAAWSRDLCKLLPDDSLTCTVCSFAYPAVLSGMAVATRRGVALWKTAVGAGLLLKILKVAGPQGARKVSDGYVDSLFDIYTSADASMR